MHGKTPAPEKQKPGWTEGLQDCILYFGIAMAVRGFVTETFSIPTGSMAPTLMGQHAVFTSPVTGHSYPFDVQPAFDPAAARGAWGFADPMVSVDSAVSTAASGALQQRSRAGDRVMVLKYLYLLQEPQRWDVVVFKNPTDPTGEAANYIKRLVGLPNEQFLILDGDVFTAPLGADRTQFAVARKPEHVQRAVWQSVYDSDYEPIDVTELSRRINAPWPGPPFEAKGFDLGATDSRRVWTHDGDGPASLEWRWERLPITDWGSYNVLRPQPPARRYAVSDVRFSAAIDADAPEALVAEYTLTTRGRAMKFALGDGKASLRIESQPGAAGEPAKVLGEASVPFSPPAAGKPFAIECWHVDQRLSLWVNGVELVQLDDAFASLEDRLRASFQGRSVEDYVAARLTSQPTPPHLSFAVGGSALELHRVRVDRDLYYRQVDLETNPLFQPPQNGPALSGPGFGTDFLNPAQLQADHFVMCGDNSGFSRDSRLLGHPSRLTTELFGDSAPFVVTRPLLLGKAWCVYFPATVPPMDALPAVMPDFGKLRFIR
jgi:signal peptidase I